MDFRKLIALLTDGLEEEVAVRNEYFLAENRILKSRLKRRLRCRDDERRSLAEIGARLGRKALAGVATLAQPDTILRWHRQLVAKKWDGSKKRHGIPSALERRKGTTWKEFLDAHRSVMAAADFFTAEVWTPLGLLTYHVLFFIRRSTRRVEIAGITRYVHARWLDQVARNASMAGDGFLDGCRFLIRDRDPRYTQSGLDNVLKGVGNEILSPAPSDRVGARDGPIRKRARLGGMLNFYCREAG